MATVLIVDDRRDFIELMGSQLELRGWVVVSTSDAKQLVEICTQSQVDAILMDLNMPDMDGCDATSQLKACPETRHIPIIICTAHAMREDRLRATESGCSDFMEKPIDMHLLLKKLEVLVAVSSQRFDGCSQTLCADEAS